MPPARTGSVARFALLALACGATLTVCDAAAQPRVRVRAETRIELRTLRDEDALRVQGVLRDDLGQPLTHQRIAVRAQPLAGHGQTAHEVVHTDAKGHFHTQLPPSEEGFRVTAAFAGDATHDRVEVERVLELDRADVRLHVSVPRGGRLDLDQREHRIAIKAESKAGGEGLRVQLVDELDRRLAAGRTDASGTVRFVVSSERLGPPGAGRLKARSTANANHAEAQTEVPIVRFRHTRLTLESSAEEASPGESVTLRGQLRDSAGPLTERAVGLFDPAASAGDGARRHLATVLTDDRGHYEHELTLETQWAPRLRVQARFHSDAPGRASSTSQPVTVQLAGAASPSWVWLLAPFALCGVLLVLLTRRAPAADAQPAATPAPGPVGVQAATRRARRPDRREVSGQILDHGTEAPVPGAMVTLVAPDGTALPVGVQPEARFRIEDVPPGRWSLRIEAEGYAPTEARLQIPHRGEWTHMRVRLENLRAKALAPFRHVASRMLPSMRQWPVKTNRELLDDADADGGLRAGLAALRDRVERAYYGPRAPTRADVEDIEQQAAELLAQLERPRHDGGGPA